MHKSDFAGLVKYITDDQNKTERLGAIVATNCEADTLQAVIAEILATQYANTRAKGDKTYHLIVSFPAGESPDPEILTQIEERICSGLGFSEHQRVSAVHHDTDNLHIHIAINKIHPDKNTLHEPYNAYYTLAQLCDLLESEYGLQKDNHKAENSLSQDRANDMERHSGIESLVSWIRRECLEEIRKAGTWQELHQIMSDNSLEIYKRGNGFVIASEDGTQVKASTVARDLSKSKLESRLGPFEPATDHTESPEHTEQPAKRKYSKQPVDFRVNTAELYAQYQTDQKQLTATRKIHWDRAKKKKNHKITAAKRANRLRRHVIKLMDGSRFTKKMLYSQAHKALTTEIQSIQKAYQQERQALYDHYKRRAWADWLKQQALDGNLKALEALRARKHSKSLQGNTLSAKTNEQPPQTDSLIRDKITKKGTTILRIENNSIRDDGHKVQISRQSTTDDVIQALHLTMQRYGHQITVNGSPQFKARVIHAAARENLPITFNEPALEQRRQQLVQENRNDQRNRQRRIERGRIDRRGTGRSGRGVANNGRTGIATGATQRERESNAGHVNPGHRNYPGNASRNVLNRPYVTGIGAEPPSFAKNRLRALSSLGVVRFTRGSEVLLPSNVSGELEHPGTQSDNPLRRRVSGAGGITPEHILAADKYINERESKRTQNIDIVKHIHYNKKMKLNNPTYAGIRHVDGHVLALLNTGNTIVVLPVDKATAQRMSRVRLGEAVAITATGSLRKSKGKSR